MEGEGSYIYLSRFVCPRGTNNLFVPWGTNIFLLEAVLTMMMLMKSEEMVVSEANIFVSEASMLSPRARIFRGP